MSKSITAFLSKSLIGEINESRAIGNLAYWLELESKFTECGPAEFEIKIGSESFLPDERYDTMYMDCFTELKPEQQEAVLAADPNYLKTLFYRYRFTYQLNEKGHRVKLHAGLKPEIRRLREVGGFTSDWAVIEAVIKQYEITLSHTKGKKQRNNSEILWDAIQKFKKEYSL